MPRKPGHVSLSAGDVVTSDAAQDVRRDQVLPQDVRRDQVLPQDGFRSKQEGKSDQIKDTKKNKIWNGTGVSTRAFHQKIYRKRYTGITGDKINFRK